MTDTLTLDQLLADWHLGDDSIGRNATRALLAAGITPTMAAKMTPAEVAATPGLGVARFQRVASQIHAITKALLAERADPTGPESPPDSGACEWCGCCTRAGCHRFADATCPTNSLGDSVCPCTED